MCVTDGHDMTLAIKMALKPNTTNQYKILLLQEMLLELSQIVQQFLYTNNKPPPKSFYEQMISNKQKEEERLAREKQKKIEIRRKKEEKEVLLHHDGMERKRKKKLKESMTCYMRKSSLSSHICYITNCLVSTF